MPDFSCEILTPYRRFFSGKAVSIAFSTDDGEIEILADHEPLVAPLRVCALRIRGAEAARVAAVTEGFVRVRKGRVDVFVDAAEWPEEIDRERAERALGRATKRLAEETQAWLIARSKRAAERARNRLRIAGLGRAPGK